MAKIELQYQEKSYTIPLTSTQITKQKIEQLIFQTWKLKFDQYTITYQDQDDDQISVFSAQDFDIAATMEQHLLILKIQLCQGAIPQIKKQIQDQKILENTPLDTPQNIVQYQKKQKTIQQKKYSTQMTEGRVRQIVRQQIHKMIPQIKNIIFPSQTKPQQITKIELQLKQKCQTCTSQLKIPFYYNPEDRTWLCHTCQQKQTKTTPLIKIRNPNHFEQIAFTYGGIINKSELGSIQENSEQYIVEGKSIALAKIKQQFKVKMQEKRKIEKELHKEKKQLKKKKECKKKQSL